MKKIEKIYKGFKTVLHPPAARAAKTIVSGVQFLANTKNCMGCKAVKRMLNK